ncbi:patatin-like protein [Pelagerythrobacter rhizovicinus]|uniref:Patatin-like protein n=1 Tax=Pelagerythrobacter rhizovicinus TaxID=2268576 RepID=A0A4Q2KR59_9SPHN|nr:patatin-like protein [Pelagerythrobacter rhizovicinus]RXZ66123.1 patatin-like protein [Pelagerythrobacter rhizovicinus]
MRQKELRIALVCYGGVSLAVYMHGVTKEIWKLASASRAFHASDPPADGVQGVYRELLEAIEAEHGLKLRVLPDILSGASAGGINAVFLAQAIHSGRSLEPLTELWLSAADVERLVDPKAEPVWRFAKYWAQPIAWWLLQRPGNAVSESVAPETQAEVRRKVSGFIRGRWFEPPFSGIGFSHLLFEALDAMANAPCGKPLLPPRHPIDLMVTTTDFRGHLELLRLNSPPVVEESEHRLPIGFTARTPAEGGHDLADPLELTFAARATASFPGAFPPLQLKEIDRLARERKLEWSERHKFLERAMPVNLRQGSAEGISLIDGSVLVNKPFEGAMHALRGRPAQREVDRRFVYIDPRPDRTHSIRERNDDPVGFFGAIFGSLSTIPREQPIRDNLEVLERQSQEAERRQHMIAALRPDVEAAVERLFGLTLFLDRPTPRRLNAWRAKAQQAAAEQAGYAFQSYAQAKFTGIVESLAELVFEAAPELKLPDARPIIAMLRNALSERGLDRLSAPSGGASAGAIAFFRAHDVGFRVRRLRLLARRLSREWDADPEIPDAAVEEARDAIYRILALYFARERANDLGEDFPLLAANIVDDPSAVIDALAARRLLPEVDEMAEQMLAEALEKMPKNLRRLMLLTYLGFPFYDVATLPLVRDDALTEFDPIKVDRISPDDARSIREGGTRATLRGIEFYNFGAFFSRAYRENDYLWGRLHGAERMIDLVCSTIEKRDEAIDPATFKRKVFLAILEEERERLRADPALLERIRSEVLATERV